MPLQAFGEIVPGLVKRIGVTGPGYQAMTLIEREAQKTSPEASVLDAR